jgi:ATP-dependent Lon protease
MAVQAPSRADVTIPDAPPVLPLRETVVFPLTVAPLVVGQPRSLRLVDDVMRGNRLLALVAQRDPKVESAGPDDLHRIGTAAVIHQMARVPDGSVRVMVQGLERIRLLDFIGTEPYVIARIEPAPEPVAQTTETDALRRAVGDIFRRLVEASPELPGELAMASENIADPRHLAYFVASLVPLDVPTRQALLEADPIAAKLRWLVDLLQRELAVRELGRKITTDTEERLSKSQREFYLREQLRSIQKELGEEGAGDAQAAAPPADRAGSASRRSAA